MVAVDPGAQVGSQGRAFQPRRMALKEQVLVQAAAQLFPHPGFISADPVKIHHFPQTQNVRMLQQKTDILGRQHRPSGFQRRIRGNTGGRQDKMPQRHGGSVLCHVQNTLCSQDICNFMGVCHYRSRSPGKNGLRKMGRCQHGTLHMDMGVDKSRNQIRALGVKYLRGSGERAASRLIHRCDPLLKQADLRRIDLAGDHVGQPAVHDAQITGNPSRSGVHKAAAVRMT